MTESTRRRAATQLPVRRLRVAVVRGEGSKQPVAFEGARVTVGAAADCDVVLSARGVSRYHLELEATPEGVRARDLGSTNGTATSGILVREAIVAPGTILALGDAAAIRVEDAELAFEPVAPEERLGDLIASSPSMRRLLDRVRRASAAEVSILITGEPGTGKELVARTIHDSSARRDGPFVVVDCAGLAGGLVPSELFGHERGAFTDASEPRRGAFERARGGTLFLDEVGELPEEVQPMLLGALERKQVRRVGGGEDIPLDVRVIACSSRDLRREVNASRFRFDLYYRLAVVKLEVPPLSERHDDIGPLVRWYLERRGVGPPHPLLSDDTVAELAAREWTGNVRELLNRVEAALAWDALDLPEPAPDDLGRSAESTAALIESLLPLPYREARARFSAALERTYLEHLLRRAGGSQRLAARLAGLDPSQLRQLLARSR